MVEVNGIIANSLLGIVLITIVIGTFLVSLLSYLANRKDKANEDTKQCQIHNEKINALEYSNDRLEKTINGGFERIHERIDELFKLLPGSNLKSYSRKG